MRELHAIGNNLNQLAAKAHATGHLDRALFSRRLINCAAPSNRFNRP
ncbi:plasmid mobilization relaxosome protein MobC [Paenibacillus sp. P26]|nr:plasmid mobilization relaxosome protein MobC [Paenibacillus sp. P26]